MDDQERIELQVARYLRTLVAFSFSVTSPVFKELLVNESDLFLANFIYAKSNVAQYNKGIQEVLENIDKINSLLKIISKIETQNITTPLLLQRDLLKIRKFLIFEKPVEAIAAKPKKAIITDKKLNYKPKAKSVRSQKGTDDGPLNKTEEKIIELVKNSSSSIQTKDVFDGLGDVSIRTVKRALGRLVRLKQIKKKLDGRNVSFVSGEVIT